MKHTCTLIAALLIAPVLAFADEKPALLPPKHIGPPLPKHAVTNRVFTGIPSMAVAQTSMVQQQPTLRCAYQLAQLFMTLKPAKNSLT